jgi:hypothetical protein
MISFIWREALRLAQGPESSEGNQWPEDGVTTGILPTLPGRRAEGLDAPSPGLHQPVSVTEPMTHGAARGGPRSDEAGPGRPSRLRARLESLATRRNALLLAGAGALVALGIFFVRPTYPNYDSYYTLIWGKELANGHLPDYDVFRTPTPHPLSTLVAAGLSWLGGAADRVLVLISLASYVILLGLLFRITQVLLGTVVAIVALLVLLTRTDLEFYALRAIIDVPFLTLVFGAVLLELRRPRRGLPVLALLTLAGLLRPEAWVLTGAYWLWLLAGRPPRSELIRYTALAAAAPLLWLVADWIVTGEPLYSLTSTREVAGQFGRSRSLPGAVKLIPDYMGGNEKIVNVISGGLGSLAALWLLRRRAALPAALMGIGVAVFLAIAAAGLSVIPRYLLIPSLFFNVGVGVSLTAWLLVNESRARRIAAGLVVLTLLLMVWRAPAYVKDARALNGQTLFVKDQYRQLKSILQHPDVGPLLGSCGPITTPTHSAIPVIRYETGLGKQTLVASIEQRRPPDRGLLFIGRSFNFEPTAARSTTGGLSSKSARKWWSNYPLSTFKLVAANEWWRVYARC